jgi:hypothetical protein
MSLADDIATATTSFSVVSRKFIIKLGNISLMRLPIRLSAQTMYNKHVWIIIFQTRSLGNNANANISLRDPYTFINIPARRNYIETA